LGGPCYEREALLKTVVLTGKQDARFDGKERGRGVGVRKNFSDWGFNGHL